MQHTLPEPNLPNLPVINERISERIANTAFFTWKTTLPVVNTGHDNHTFLIPSEGIAQFNAELNRFETRLTLTEIEHIGGNDFLTRVTATPEGDALYNALTLTELNALDYALRLKHGNTIIGYTICEEIYLKTLNSLVWLFCQRCSGYDYPPLPEAYSKRLLTFIQRPLVVDMTASLRVTLQSYLLFIYFTHTYSQYTLKNQDDEAQFYHNNIPWFLLAFGSEIVVSLVLLRSGCVNKSYVLSAMLRLRWIKQSIIGVVSNLTNYGPFLVSASVIEDSFLPLIILGGVIGYYKQVGNVINIAEWTAFQFLLRSFFLSLTVGSFCALGFFGLIKDVFILYDADVTAASYAEFLQAQSVVRYLAFTIMLLVSLFRTPSASLTTQHWGRMASQVMEGISVALLDNFALYLLIEGSIYTLNGSLDFSPQKPLAPTFYCGLQAVSFIVVFLVTFPTTSDLPKYSLEKNPINPTWITKTLRFFNSIPGKCLSSTSTEDTATHAASKDGVEFKTRMFSNSFRTFSVSQFYPRSQSRDVQPPIENPMNELNSGFSEETKSTPLGERYATKY